MSDYPRPAGLDAFARCPTPGCIVDVYAPFLVPVRCASHGGPLDLPQRRGDDPFGLPLSERGGSSTAAPRPPAA